VRCLSLAVGRQLLDRDDLKRLYKAAGRQAGSLTVRSEPLTQVLLERVPMGGLALVGTDRGELPLIGVGVGLPRSDGQGWWLGQASCLMTSSWVVVSNSSGVR
jgi:hypothetical protein